MPHRSSTRTVHQLPQRALGSSLRLYFGGTFDPPHIGHAILPRRVLEQIGQPDGWLVYVPAARSPHKDTNPSPDQDRLEMLDIMLDDTDRCVIWDIELRRAKQQPGQPSYWVDTWDRVGSLASTGNDRYLIGADQARSMHRWHRYESIWKDALVMLRGEHDDPERLMESLAQTGAWDDAQLEHWRRSIVLVEMIDASSTTIRAKLAQPETRKNPIAGLDDRVHDFILKRGLYT